MKRAHRQARDLLYEAVNNPKADLRFAAKLAIILLGPSGKRTRAKPRDAAKTARRTTVKELDAMCRAIVFARDGGACQWDVCGTTQGLIDWAHILSRRHTATRWDTRNSVVLCRKHHMQWHDRPMDAARWFQKRYGEPAYNALVARSQATRCDKVLTRLHLEAEAKKLGVSLPPTGKVS
jgi:5-methylcytosine-specific restriction endonuclease McrA